MRKSDIPEISVDDILRRIKMEIERRESTLRREDAQETIQIAPRLLPEESHQLRFGLDDLLWKYGTKYSKTINKIPVLRSIAKKQYWRLSPMKKYQHATTPPPQPNQMDLEFLGTNWYYHDFIEQTKREGLKGRIKRFILKYMGFYTWWQGQINRIIYKEFIRQRAEIAERDKMIGHMKDELMERNRINEDLHAKIVSELRQEIAGMSIQLGEHKLNLLNQQRRLDILFDREEGLFLSTMHPAFQDRFRGTEAEIKERLSVYLPYIRGVGAGGDEAPILDLGCGRGEWLELCRENHLLAKGVEKSQAMVTRCHELGLDVIEGDAIAVLRNQTMNGLQAITGFHLIEHLHFNSLISLFDETLRVLKPGGIVIFETPNPENILVGSCNFYTDPTHKIPLVPELIKFLGEQRGFVKIEILRLNRRKEPKYIGDEFVDELVYRFNMEQDYAFIGYKP